MRTVLVTGAAGFIGMHLSHLLMRQGFRVIGYDGMTDYYDPKLKSARLNRLREHNSFSFAEAMLEDFNALQTVCEQEKPDIIVHLAGQAGVRYSLEAPRTYVDSNLVGTFNVMECARQFGVEHLLMASSSSVYGGNSSMPFRETDKADWPLTIYGATKKAMEAMGHSYAHLWSLPVTMFRFFTVYGPWGRPDMAPHRFTSGIFEGRPIDVYNNGDMYRDFTFVTDLVRGIFLLIDARPPKVEGRGAEIEGDSLSPIAPFRVVNIGNSTKVRLLDFIEAFEKAAGKQAIKNMLPMQPGDVPATYADASLLQRLTNYRPQTDITEGAAQFVAWYREYYKV